MQPPARDGLTTAQVTALIQDAPALEVSAGLELLDTSLAVVEDLTADFLGGTVRRASYATLHGSAELHLARELNWATAIVRPYMTLTDGTTSARFNLGAYLTSKPRTAAGRTPTVHEIEGVDVLHTLNTHIGETHTVPAGTTYLAAAEQIMIDHGVTTYRIDQTAADKTVATAQNWLFSDDVTWLNVANDLLQAVGYQGIWSDWDGYLRMQPYQLPADRGPEWLYDTGTFTSMIGPQRVTVRDWFNVPNRWTFYWSQDPTSTPPVEGAGIYSYTNDLAGPTSVEARGRVIAAKPEQINVADQESLVAAARSKIDADMNLKTIFEVWISPNPLHWHFDRVSVNDPDLGPLMDVLVSEWQLQLGREGMTQTWTLL